MHSGVRDGGLPQRAVYGTQVCGVVHATVTLTGFGSRPRLLFTGLISVS